MTQGIDGALERQLEALEDRGRHHLTVAARRDARQAGGSAAAAAMIAVPIVLWLLVELVHPGMSLLIVTAIAIPLAAFAISYAAARRRQSVKRNAALAVFDHRPGMNDRVRIADEFGHLADRDGFREAAVREAEPWLRQALDMPIEEAGTRERSRWQRWPLVVAAAVVTLVVLGFHGQDPAATSSGVAPARRILAAIGASGARLMLGERADESAQSIPAERAGGAGDGGDGGTARAAQDERWGREGDADGRMGGSGNPGAPASRSASSGRSAASAGTAATGRQGRGRDGDAARTAASPAPAERGGAGVADAEGGAGAAPAAPNAPARQPETPSAASAAAPSGGTPPPPRPASDSRSGTRPNSPNRQQSQQSSQSDGQGSGRSGQQGAGRGFGHDALKKTRGTSALLLAVPMEDRVIGTINAGRVTSVTRPSLPRAVPVGMVAAQARDGRGGDAGRIVHRATTVQENRLLGRFFQRRARGE